MVEGGIESASDRRDCSTIHTPRGPLCQIFCWFPPAWPARRASGHKNLRFVEELRRLMADGSKIASENGLLDSRTATVRRRIPEHKMNAPRLGKLESDSRLRRRSFQEIALLQQFHLPAHLIHEGSAFRLGGFQKRMFGCLPIFRTHERDRQEIETVLLRWALFDQWIGKQQAVRKDHNSTGV